MVENEKKSKLLYINIAFVCVAVGILLFLFNAPEETTARLPHDDNHERFFQINSKKEAEKHCEECHSPNKSAPLHDQHPPKYRCLFCHKR